MLPDGYYAVRSKGESCRLLWLKTITGELGAKDKGMFGKRILYYKKTNGWQAFAFLGDDGSLHIHRKFSMRWTPEQLLAIRAAVVAIQQEPELARALYEEVTAVKQ